MAAPQDELADIRRVQLDVKGMSCIACARRVQKELNKIDGVRASVDIKTKVAVVDAGREISVSELCDAVERAGYSAEERAAGTADVVEDSPGHPIELPAKRSVRARKLLRWLTFGHLGTDVAAAPKPR